MMGHRGAKKGGDEWDAFTPWRHRLYWHRGELRRLKRKYNKRQRKIARTEAQSWISTFQR